MWYRRSLVIGPEGGFGARTGGISVDLTVHQSKDFLASDQVSRVTVYNHKSGGPHKSAPGPRHWGQR